MFFVRCCRGVMRWFRFFAIYLLFVYSNVCGMHIKDVFNTTNCAEHNGARRFATIEDEARAYLKNSIETDMYAEMTEYSQNEINQKFKQYYEVTGDESFQKSVSDSINTILETKIAQELIKVIICKLETRKEFVNCLDDICKSIQDSIDNEDEALDYKLCLFANNFFIKNLFANRYVLQYDCNIEYADKEEFKDIGTIMMKIDNLYNNFIASDGDISLLEELRLEFNNCTKTDTNYTNIKNLTFKQKTLEIFENFFNEVTHIKANFAKISFQLSDECGFHYETYYNAIGFCNISLLEKLNDINLYVIDSYENDNVYLKIEKKYILESAIFHELTHCFHVLVYKNSLMTRLRDKTVCIKNFINLCKSKNKTTSFANILSDACFSNDEEFSTMFSVLRDQSLFYRSFFCESFYNMAVVCENFDDTYIVNIEHKNQITPLGQKTFYQSMFHDYEELYTEMKQNNKITGDDELPSQIVYSAKYIQKFFGIGDICIVNYGSEYRKLEVLELPSINKPIKQSSVCLPKLATKKSVKK